MLPRRCRRAAVSLVAATAAFLAVQGAHASVNEEQEMGREFLEQAHQFLPLIEDYEAKAFITDIGERLVATLGAQPFDYRFFVLAADDINAFSVPSGKIVFHCGLISRVESEDELAGVMGHEIAHAHAHHVVRQQKKGAPLTYASLLGALLGAVVDPSLALGILGAGQAAQLTYQRDFEREADYLGVEYAAKAGFARGAIMHLLRKLYKQQQLNPTYMPAYLMSHPLSGERLTNLEAVLGTTEWQDAKLTRSNRLRRVAATCDGISKRRHDVVPVYERALAAADEAGRPEALEMIGLLMTHGEDYALAEGYLEQARDAGRSVDRELGRVYLRRGRLEDARPLLEKALAAAPKDWSTMADLGTLEFQQGNHQAAVELLDRSLVLHKWRTDVVRTLGRAEAKLGRQGRGFYRFAQAAELEGNRVLAHDYYQRALVELPADDALRADIEEHLDPLADEIKEAEARGQIPGRPGRGPRPGETDPQSGR